MTRDSTGLGRVVALIPLRGGSKSIPRKNIRPIAGKPLCYWTLFAATNCPLIDEVWVSTDDQEIRGVVLGLGLNVHVLDRPVDLATDTAGTEDVMLHFAQAVPHDVLVTIQATSPLLGSKDLTDALQRMQDDGFDSLVSGVLSKRFYWSADGTPLNYDPLNRPRRQDFPGTIMENGAFYLTRRSTLERHRCRLGDRIAVHVMPDESAVEIDELPDWDEVERILIAHHPKEIQTDIRLLVIDVDGTLTDGGMYYGPDGEALKKFNTGDAQGLMSLRKMGVEVAVVTGENSPAVHARMKKLDISHYHPGTSNKISIVDTMRRELGIEWQHIAAIGDDVNDQELLLRVGAAACPADAQPIIRNLPSVNVMDRNGGNGAVREFCDMLLHCRRHG